MRLEAVLRTLTNNKVVSRVWVVAIVPAGVAMTADQVHAIWHVSRPPRYAAAVEYARVIGCSKRRGAKSRDATVFKLLDDNPRSSAWVEYIEHPDKPPIALPVAPEATQFIIPAPYPPGAISGASVTQFPTTSSSWAVSDGATYDPVMFNTIPTPF